ncbi:MAG: hypothetical protein M1821_009521 [Bathelium mastoideum]|nr:MAG: hypothetical protein M1821_009521 [Bathelium mastoideum]
MSTMITFAADNDLFRKRKRVYRACASCKKRRKRCDHTFADEEKGRSTTISPSGGENADDIQSSTRGKKSPLSTQASKSQVESVGDVPIDSASEVPSSIGKSTANNPSRFIGDMTPESVLRGQIKERGIGGPGQSQVGYFISIKDKEPSASEDSERAQSVGLAVHRGIDQQRNIRIQNALESYLQALGISLLPSPTDTDALVHIYFSSVQPLLPIVHEEGFKADYKSGTAPKILVQAVCLVASRHDAARPHLRLQDESDALLEPIAFADRLYSSIVAALNAHLESDKLILIQVNALLAINREVSAEHDDNSVHLAKAIQYAFSIGLHLGRARKEHRDEWMEKIFWCLWSLDKLANGSINARPTQLKEADIGLNNMMNMKRHRHTAFGLWLRLCTYLEEIITFYRPSADPASTGWEEDFPAFEEVVGAGGDKIQNETITLLELLYHCVAMLSCRSRSIDGPTRSTPSYVRASLSAVRVISIMESPSAKNLPPLPVADWSLALSMSFAYRQFRQSKLSMHKARAKEDLERCCHILDGLKNVWHSAGVMAEMGKAAIKKVNKVSKATGERMESINYSTAAGQPKRLRRDVESTMTNQSCSDESRNDTASFEHGLMEPFQAELYPSIPRQHPTSSTRGEPVAGNASQPAQLSNNPSHDDAFDNIDAVLGSYPDLNFQLDFSDVLASLDEPNPHVETSNLFLG